MQWGSLCRLCRSFAVSVTFVRSQRLLKLCSYAEKQVLAALRFARTVHGDALEDKVHSL